MQVIFSPGEMNKTKRLLKNAIIHAMFNIFNHWHWLTEDVSLTLSRHTRLNVVLAILGDSTLDPLPAFVPLSTFDALIFASVGRTNCMSSAPDKVELLPFNR